MTIEKYVCPPNDGSRQDRVIFTTRTYAQTLWFLVDLYNEAKKDFPNLKMSDVDVNRYGGDSRNGMYGIEFYGDTIPKEYIRINDLNHSFPL